MAADGHPILAVGVCTVWHAMLGVDRVGELPTPLLLWNDMRAAPQALVLRGSLESAAVHRRTGCALHPSFLPARLLWLREARPEIFERCERFVSFGEILEHRLFGAWRVGLSMASGTGLLDQNALAWDREMLRAARIEPGQLSPLVLSHEPRAGMVQEAARRLPALKDVPFFPALGDGACNTVGSGATGAGIAALMIGTSAALRRIFDGDCPPAPTGLWRYLLDRRRALIGGALSNGGNLYAWMTRTLRLDDPPEALERRLTEAEPGAHGLVVLPFLAGERNPDYPLDATGLFAGVRLSTTPFDLLQAGLEAVGYRLAAIADRMDAAGCAPAEYLASGGLVHSPAWTRMLADVLGRPVTLSPLHEASARGAALLALESLGRVPNALAAPVPAGQRIEPDPARHRRYADARKWHEATWSHWRDFRS
jgi:gluconokinase